MKLKKNNNDNDTEKRRQDDYTEIESSWVYMDGP